ncbi:hypothetical protein BKA83DRAFT_1018373 [Pisolithus microcarpus]|nr:hypothetical protein BKA83DRAFT_1018373 [Pisolithus microcarpus]
MLLLMLSMRIASFLYAVYRGLKNVLLAGLLGFIAEIAVTITCVVQITEFEGQSCSGLNAWCRLTREWSLCNVANPYHSSSVLPQPLVSTTTMLLSRLVIISTILSRNLCNYPALLKGTGTLPGELE